MSYSRTKVLTNEIYAPTNPSSEADARSQLDGAIQEVYDMLAAVAAGASGADYINSAPIAGVTGTTLYEMLSNIYTQLTAVALGSVPDDSITDAKLSGTAGAVKPVLTTHVVDYNAHVFWGGITTGPANTYATSTPAISAYTTGMAIAVKFNLDSTGASTLNINGKGAKAIKNANGNDATNLKAAGVYTLRYDGTNFILQGEGATGDATAPDLLSGKTATTDLGEITGTMPNRAGDTAALSSSVSGTTLQLIPSEGYRDGVDDKVTLTDANFVAESIIGTLFGKAGSAKKAATGSVVNDANTLTFYYPNAGGSQSGLNYFTVSGLSFTPSKIIAYYKDSSTGQMVQYVNDSLLSDHSEAKIVCELFDGDTYNTATKCYMVDGTSAYVTDSGFRFPLPGSLTGGTLYWYAFE